MAQRVFILSLKLNVCTYAEFWIRFWGLKPVKQNLMQSRVEIHWYD